MIKRLTEIPASTPHKVIAVKITGTIYGYIQEGELPVDAQKRIALGAEMLLNESGHLRAHFFTDARYGFPAIPSEIFTKNNA